LTSQRQLRLCNGVPRLNLQFDDVTDALGAQLQRQADENLARARAWRDEIVNSRIPEAIKELNQPLAQIDAVLSAAVDYPGQAQALRDEAQRLAQGLGEQRLAAQRLLVDAAQWRAAVAVVQQNLDGDLGAAVTAKAEALRSDRITHPNELLENDNQVATAQSELQSDIGWLDGLVATCAAIVTTVEQTLGNQRGKELRLSVDPSLPHLTDWSRQLRAGRDHLESQAAYLRKTDANGPLPILRGLVEQWLSHVDPPVPTPASSQALLLPPA